MPLTFFNTLTKRKEEFTPITPGEVKLYTCGPTIYGFAHIGNFRAYIFEDILRRYLEYKGFKVVHVMNITDVDDKTIRDSRKEGKSLKEYTEPFKQAFFQDRDSLNIKPAHFYPEATTHIPEMIELVKILREKGFTYEADGSIYFRISSFPNYGALSGYRPSDLRAGARVDVDEYEKEEARDFVLWKARRPEDGDVYWDTELGQGRPGWHLECSAMSMKYLGKTFDIHCGGEDNIFPHHENEIAQSEAATGVKFVNYWLHCGYLLVEGRKMSKSLGNFYTLRDLTDRGFDPKAVRYVLLSTHYRQQLNFSEEAARAAKASIDRLQDFISALNMIEKEGENVEVNGIIDTARGEFEKHMDDDLNISPALGALFIMVKEINRKIADDSVNRSGAVKALKFLRDIDGVFGVLNFASQSADEEVERLIRERMEVRERKDFARADEIRRKLAEMKIVVEDTPQGPRWKRI